MYLWQQHADSAQVKHKIALRDYSQGEVFTWQQLAEKIDEVARVLLQQGIRASDGVALCGKNNLSLLCFYFGALQIGARVLGVNPAFPQEKIRQICADNDVKLCVILRSENPVYIKYEKKRLHFKGQFKEQSVTMTLTSGSTGMPKAVVHDIQAHLANAKGVCERLRFDANHSWLLSLPLYHISGQGILWRWLLQGAELHLAGSDFYLSVATATHVSLVPTQAQRFLSYVRASGAMNVITRCILLGGAHIPTELTGQLKQLGIQSYSSYGMTEMASTVFAKESDDKDGVGQPLVGREYCLVNDEIWLRGDGVGLGYWQDGEIVPFVNSQGWFQTKDKGQWLNNELVVSGRLDNMFISGGENIQPEEIERVIRQSEAVEQVFILPVDDQEFGRRPVAMIKFKQAFSQSAVNKLQLWLSNKIEKFKQPIAYFPLHCEKLQPQGTIKVSRAALAAELTQLLGKY
ncbi:MAG TPA: o-succinylbenzoate--CoA ligase [Pasteurellaceae bacterium]|nr:o-succinylbenzoate--CoA ligase [Pasteurellaceae bacterium]